VASRARPCRTFPSRTPGQGKYALRSARQASAARTCTSDDEYPVSLPVVVGHEVTGVVDAVGDAVAAENIGRRVSIETYYATCGSCQYCREGQQNLCADRRSIGTHVNGGFAEYVVVPAINAHDVHPSVGAMQGRSTSPVVRRARSLRSIRASPGDNAVVVGPGAMGLLAAQVLAAEGASVTVAGLATDRARLLTAEQLGFRALEVPALGEVSPRADVVVDCSGAAAGVATALRWARRGGGMFRSGCAGKRSRSILT